MLLDKAGDGFTIQATGSGVTDSITNSFNVAPAAASQLVVTTQPPVGVSVDNTFGLVVSALDPYGNLNTNFGGSVAVSLSNNSGGGTLGGTRSVTAQNGVAAISDLTLNAPGTGYFLEASSTGLTNAISDTFEAFAGPVIYTVSALTDTGAGSGTTGDLLYCIEQANAAANSDGSLIQFSSSLFRTPQTIALSSTLVLSGKAGPEVISGPGAGLVSISGGGTSGVFVVDNGVTATLSGLTITGGKANSGGGLYDNGTVTLIDCTIRGNSATSSGGGLWINGTATLTDCTVSGNSAQGADGKSDTKGGVEVAGSSGGDGSDASGGGVYLASGQLTIVSSMINSNVAAGGNGGPGARGPSAPPRPGERVRRGPTVGRARPACLARATARTAAGVKAVAPARRALLRPQRPNPVPAARGRRGQRQRRRNLRCRGYADAHRNVVRIESRHWR